jgi:photosystem I subunit III
MKRFLLMVLAFFSVCTIALTDIPSALAVNTTLVPCRDSPAFQQRQKNAPKNYYYTKPFESYSSELLCGEDGLPHLPLDRLNLAIDVIIPIAIFLYTAGFIGWSGRAYLLVANQAKNPEEMEIFIDLPLAIRSIVQGLLWPLLALKEFTTGELTAKDNEISVSPR